MLTIDTNKFNFRDCAIERVTDGSVRIVRFTAPKDNKSELLTLKKLYYADRVYELSVNLPPIPKLETVALISHTSANSWRVVVSNFTSVEVNNYRTYGDVSEYLQSVFKM